MAPKLILLAIFIVATFAAKSATAGRSGGGDNYVRNACSVTKYRNLCIRSLSPFSAAAKDSPSVWARAGVAVTLSDAKAVARYLIKLNRTRGGGGGGRYYRAALSDCTELFENAIDELHKSLGVLRSLTRRAFGTQMGNLNTWLSAALTDTDTCMDGFESQKRRRGVRLIRGRVSRTSYIASNALALVNKLAASGLGREADAVDP